MVTPLWIVAGFVTLTEAVLGVALTQVSGYVQIVLTWFVVLFATAVAGAFFYILWNRPYVFYSPAEYGGTNFKEFIETLRGKIPEQLREQIQAAEAKPQDDTAQFALIDSLLDDAIRQHVLLMKEKRVALPISEYGGARFETGKADGSWMSGTISSRQIAEKLGGSGLVAVETARLTVRLTDLGGKFADWLIASGKRNDYYSSPFGGWGTPVPSPFLARQVHDALENPRDPSQSAPVPATTDGLPSEKGSTTDEPTG